MESFEIYNDIATRTKGDIYVGVVGPVRTGKSTFISKVMNLLVLPNITDASDKERATDEMPQSGDGKSIMTTQPHFVPNEAVKICVADNVNLKVRFVDCVGYMVAGALGDKENDQPRLVATPWTQENLPFEKAAELGTNKVIATHSTIGVLVTTDGSITGIDRQDYAAAEEKVVAELERAQKPYIVVLNSTHPDSAETVALARSLQEKYKTKVLAMDIKNAGQEDVDKIFANILTEFPIVSIDVDMPSWLKTLPYNHPIILEIKEEIMEKLGNVNKIGELNGAVNLFENSENFEPTSSYHVEMGNGTVVVTLQPKEGLFYKVLSEWCGEEIADDYTLAKFVKDLAVAKKQYVKFQDALQSVNETGYGVVYPSDDEMVFNDPEIVKMGSKKGVKLTATAPSLHIMRVDLTSEVSPFLGSEQQSEDMSKYLMDTYATDKQAFWDTKMFGKTLHSMVADNINNKLYNMPKEAMKKMKKTMTRIVNEGKGGVICILL